MEYFSSSKIAYFVFQEDMYLMCILLFLFFKIILVQEIILNMLFLSKTSGRCLKNIRIKSLNQFNCASN